MAAGLSGAHQKDREQEKEEQKAEAMTPRAKLRRLLWYVPISIKSPSIHPILFHPFYLVSNLTPFRSSVVPCPSVFIFDYIYKKKRKSIYKYTANEP